MTTRRIATQVGLLVTLLALSVFLGVRTTLGSQNTVEKRGPVTKVVKKGPVTVENVVWRLDQLQVFTRLVNEDKEPVELEVPDGATIVKATLTLTATERTRLNKGFSCDAMLRDDRGNVWEDKDVSGVELPTFCGDYELKIERSKPFKIVKIYVVPKEAVPHLVGLVTPEVGNTSADERVLITP